MLRKIPELNKLISARKGIKPSERVQYTREQFRRCSGLRAEVKALLQPFIDAQSIKRRCMRDNRDQLLHRFITKYNCWIFSEKFPEEVRCVLNDDCDELLRRFTTEYNCNPSPAHWFLKQVDELNSIIAPMIGMHRINGDAEKSSQSWISLRLLRKDTLAN